MILTSRSVAVSRCCDMDFSLHLTTVTYTQHNTNTHDAMHEINFPLQLVHQNTIAVVYLQERMPLRGTFIYHAVDVLIDMFSPFWSTFRFSTTPNISDMISISRHQLESPGGA